jgi:predicted DNA-binding protein (MmcQ/YjbR family)
VICQERQAYGQAATWLDPAAQQPMIQKMYGLLSSTGDSANRVLKRVPEMSLNCRQQPTIATSSNLRT